MCIYTQLSLERERGGGEGTSDSYSIVIRSCLVVGKDAVALLLIYTRFVLLTVTRATVGSPF